MSFFSPECRLHSVNHEQYKGTFMIKTKIAWQCLAIMACFFLAGQTVAAEQTRQAVVSDSEFQKSVLFYVNEYRAKRHLSALKMNNNISQEAAKHSRDMASKAMPFGHNDFNGRIKRLYRKIAQCNGGAENVAYWRYDAKKLVDGWIASSGHRQNIVGNYNLTGIGIAHGKTGWAYYTQIFIRSDAPRVG